MKSICLALCGLALLGSALAENEDRPGPPDPIETLHELSAERGRIEAWLDFLDRDMSTWKHPDLPANAALARQDYLEEQRQLAALELAGLGDEHPLILRKRKILAAKKQLLDETLLRLRRDLHTRLQRIQADESALRAELKESSPQAAREAPDNAALIEQARQDYKDAENRLNDLRTQLIGEQLGKRIHEAPVVLHHQSTATPSYSWPHAVLISSGGGLFVLLVLGAIAWLRKPKSPASPATEGTL